VQYEKRCIHWVPKVKDWEPSATQTINSFGERLDFFLINFVKLDIAFLFYLIIQCQPFKLALCYNIIYSFV
jgi:hypothetical protein